MCNVISFCSKHPFQNIHFKTSFSKHHFKTSFSKHPFQNILFKTSLSKLPFLGINTFVFLSFNTFYRIYRLFSLVFSCESSSRNANVCQTVNLSICQSFCQSVTLTFLSNLLVYFTIANRIK